jgi:hypothetical protein
MHMYLYFSNLLKKFTKADKPPAPPPDPVYMPLPPKPMLRFYLLGYGVPSIVCGITAAVSLDHYAEPNMHFILSALLNISNALHMYTQSERLHLFWSNVAHKSSKLSV